MSKEPPPDRSIINRIIKAGGQRLPGMVPSSPIPDSNQQSGGEELTLQDDNGDFMEWWLLKEPWKELEHPNTEKDDAKALKQKAENLQKALYVYDYLLCEQGPILQGQIKELEEVAQNTDKEVKTADITRGTVGAIGMAAVVGGFMFAPLTRGASLAVSAMGFGVAAFWSAISNKAPTDVDRKKVKTIFQVYSTQMEEIERCLKFISSNVAYLKKYDLNTLKGVDSKAEKMVRIAHHFKDSVGLISAVSKCLGLIQGFVMGMDMCFCKDDNKQLKKLKLGSVTKFAKQICVLAKQMQVSLDELIMFKTAMESADM